MGARKIGFWVLLLVLMLIGVGLLVLASAVELPRPLTDLVPGAGTALLIGGILGVSVDRWLKQRLLRDAFKSLFGYVLPEQLRGELDWVYTREVLVERSDLVLTITPIEDSDLLNVCVEWHRDVRNITSRTVKWLPKLSLDEWFHEGHQTQVIALTATQDGQTYKDSKDATDKPFIVRSTLDELSLKPDETVTFLAEGEETRHRSDAWFLTVQAATVHPRVTIHAPEQVAWYATFGNRQAVSEIGPVTRELTGTLLPGQVIQIRWWPREAVA